MNHFESVGGLLRKPEVSHALHYNRLYFDAKIYSIHAHTPTVWSSSFGVYGTIFDVWILLVERLMEYNDHPLAYSSGYNGDLYFNLN